MKAAKIQQMDIQLRSKAELQSKTLKDLQSLNSGPSPPSQNMHLQSDSQAPILQPSPDLSDTNNNINNNNNNFEDVNNNNLDSLKSEHINEHLPVNIYLYIYIYIY